MDKEPVRLNREVQRYTNQEQVAASARLVRGVQELYEDLITDASTKGLDEITIQNLLIDGWNNGAIPKIVQGAHFRGSGFVLQILHGAIPTDIFNHFAKDEDDFGVILPNEDYPQGSLTLDFPRGIASQANSDKPTAFYVERLLPQMSGHQNFPEIEVAKKLDKITNLMEPS